MDIDDIELFIVNNRKDGAMIERLSFALGFSKDVNTQAEPERKGLEGVAMEVALHFIEFPPDSHQLGPAEFRKQTEDWERRRDGMIKQITPILRTLAPECHIEAAADDLISKLEQRATVAEAGEAALRGAMKEIQEIAAHEDGQADDPQATDAIFRIAFRFASTPSPGAKIVEALEEIANHDKTSDYEWYDSWGDMKGVDISNNGDVHSHGFSMGTHSCAKIARQALGRE